MGSNHNKAPTVSNKSRQEVWIWTPCDIERLTKTVK
jgi:hypothetical protein